MEVLPALLGCLRRCCETLPDKRTGNNTTYPMADFGLAAFSVFFMQSPSFLAHQRQLEKGQGRSNCQTLFGMDRIPTDNHIRALLDPVPPEHFFPLFRDVLAALEGSGGLSDFRRLGEHVLIALDGTQYHCSDKVHCPQCSSRARGGKTEYFHTLVAASIVAPGHSRVVPLEPEFVVPQDGTRNRTAKAGRRGVGWPLTARVMQGSIRSISATISMPASRCARRCGKAAATSCSCASPPRIPPSKHI